MLRELGEAGLSSREGCGNTVRNVTGDPRAGTLTDELFDITPYAGAYVRYFVRHPTTQMMPRKIKTAFTATDADNAITQIHDVAFTPRLRDGVRGVEVRVGGGTAIMPRLAPVLYDFVELDNGDYLKVTEAVLRIFDRQDFLRVNRARARIKVLVDKIGIDAFREMVEEELAGDWVAERDFSIDGLLLEHDEQAHARRSAAQLRLSQRRSARVRPLPREQCPGPAPAGLLDRRGHGPARRRHARAAARPRPDHARLLRRLRPYDACTRTSCCAGSVTSRSTTSGSASGSSNWAITAPTRSPTSSAARAPTPASSGSPARWDSTVLSSERLAEMEIDDPLTRRIHIKMSGCPNGCSQHHLANIGFYGASIKVGEHTIPAYIAHIGGSYENGDVRFGDRLKSRLPAKRVPDAVERWVRFYESEREQGEEFNAFAAARRRRMPSRSTSRTWRCRWSSPWRT